MFKILPDDWQSALLVGRIETAAGPSPVLVRGGRIFDISAQFPTVVDFIEIYDGTLPADLGVDLGAVDSFTGTLLAPVDLQVIKAAGVTFAISALERVIEERARGDASQAQTIRTDLAARIGSDISTVKPGSPTAEALKAALIADGLWSQYLEVAIGPDAEIFTKCPVLGAVGYGAKVGVRSDSSWNNPEPEIAFVVNSKGETLGAVLGNDVNLRDFEGRSALLLGKAKDNNAACALGPFIRLFDAGFTLDNVRAADVSLEVEGLDGFKMSGKSSMSLIARDPLDLVAQTIGKHHQYPDGFVLFTGTMFAPTQDRGTAGQGFTHNEGDIVRVFSPRLGCLENTVTTCDKAPPWTMGIRAFYANLKQRGLV
jgi:fumarylacetoacetate (FAA) hydrolase family protein